ncbi:MAG: hypothetical protein IT457_00175 [Planctomycetes bacterium]|nr:hypothetical protein [Planctomycetota bacterium]
MSRGRLGRLAPLAVLTACATGLRPLELPLATDARTFEVCLEVLRSRFGRLAITDREAFLLQTEWSRVESPGRLLRRRATIFRAAPERLAVVVEESLLVGGLLGEPSWSVPKAQPSLERALAASIEAALGA